MNVSVAAAGGGQNSTWYKTGEACCCCCRLLPKLSIIIAHASAQAHLRARKGSLRRQIAEDQARVAAVSRRPAAASIAVADAAYGLELLLLQVHAIHCLVFRGHTRPPAKTQSTCGMCCWIGSAGAHLPMTTCR